MYFAYTCTCAVYTCTCSTCACSTCLCACSTRSNVHVHIIYQYSVAMYKSSTGMLGDDPLYNALGCLGKSCLHILVDCNCVGTHLFLNHIIHVTHHTSHITHCTHRTLHTSHTSHSSHSQVIKYCGHVVDPYYPVEKVIER